MSEFHIPDHDLERYYLAMITDEAELARVEEHLLVCPKCVARAEETKIYVDAMRSALKAEASPGQDAPAKDRKAKRRAPPIN